MGGKIAQEKWETERSNRKESLRSINEAQYPSDSGDIIKRKRKKRGKTCDLIDYLFNLIGYEK